jgi:HD-GYP domain-containing protein (c-di-GMP phosphodiesterase class II)
MAIELDELQIFVDELEIGMYVTRLDRPWEETPFLFQGFLIESMDEIESLRETCKHVFIQTKHKLEAKRSAGHTSDKRKEKKGLFARKVKKNSDQSSGTTSAIENRIKIPSRKYQYINKVSTESEFPKAKQNYEYAKELSKNIMDGIRIGLNLDMKESKEVVSGIVDSIIRNSNALIWLSKLKNKDEYTAEHSLNVCILSVAFAKHLGHSEHEIRKIGLCGLLHDVGKAKIPLEILNKPGRFTSKEYEIMAQHPLFGRDLLIAATDSDHSAVDVAYSHHERMDEKGYPRKLMSHQIPYYAKLVALVDAYDAITSSRCYDDGRSSMDALDIIYKSKGQQFDEELAIEFIKCIGIYPPGSIVEMSCGEVAIIIASNQESKLKPRVILVLDSEKKKCKEKVIDLRKSPKDASGNEYRIIKEIPNGKYGVYLKEYMEKGLVLDKP